MTILTWRGDAQGRAQVDKLTPANIEIGDIFTITCNRKDISVTAVAAGNNTQAELINSVCNLLISAIGQYNNAIAEFFELSASAYMEDTANPTYASAVKVTGPTDGKPFTLTTSTTNANNYPVVVTTVVDGVAAVNEIQRVYLPGPPTGGTFTLTFDGQTTAATAFNASAATITTNLEALSNIAPGDVTVTGTDARDFTVTFSGAYAGVNVPLMTGDGTSLTGGATVTVATTTQGSPGVNEVQTLTVVQHTIQGGTSELYYYKLTFNGQTTAYIESSATAATVQSALEALSNIGTGDITVSRVLSGDTLTYTITFVGALGYANQNLLTLSGNQILSYSGVLYTNGSEITIVETTAGSSTAVNEIQTITVNNRPYAGTFTVTFSGATTAAQAFDESAANLQADLEALATIGVGNIAVTRAGSGTLAAPYVYTCTFQGTLAGTDVSEMTGSGASLTGSGVNVSVTQEAATGNNEQEAVTIQNTPTGGTFTLTFNAETTAGIAYNATAATVQAALEALATPVPGDFTVTGGPGPSAPWFVEFKGAYAKTNVTQMTGSGASLTGAGTQSLTRSAVTTPTGPAFWGEPENWSTGSNPATGDIVYVRNIANPILYGLEDLVAQTLAELHIDLSMTGNVGLADIDAGGSPEGTPGGYFQYRPKFLKQPATLLFIGEGEGPGNSLTRIDTSSILTTILQYGAGDPADTSMPTVQWIGTHASNVARIFKGSFGAAVGGAEAAVLLTLQVGYQDEANRESDAEVWIGQGCNLEDVEISGGDVEIDLSTYAVGDLVMSGGELRVIGDNGCDLIRLSGAAVLFWNSTGVIDGTPIVADQAVLSFAQDMREKIVNNPIEVYSVEAHVDDPHRVVRAPSLIVLADPVMMTDGLVLQLKYSETTCNESQFGTNVVVARGVPT